MDDIKMRILNNQPVSDVNITPAFNEFKKKVKESLQKIFEKVNDDQIEKVVIEKK